MIIEIRYSEDDYNEHEKLEVFIDSEMVSEMRISSDCPEDNNIGRLGISDFIAKITRKISPDSLISFTTSEWKED